MNDGSFKVCSPKVEARSLYRMLGQDGNTVEALRELIAVPPQTERALRAFARLHPEEAPGIERTLMFRQAVTREFERLVCAGVAIRDLTEVEVSGSGASEEVLADAKV